MTRTIGLSTVLLAFLTSLPAMADTPLKFEVASIKVATSGVNGVRGGCHGIDTVYTSKQQDGAPPLGRCVITDGRLSHLIGIAFGVSMQQLNTGADWIQRGDLRFDVQAKAEQPQKTTEKQLLTMLQNLLVERFQLKFHLEPKEEAGFALTVAKNGPKLQKSTSAEEDLEFTGAKKGGPVKPGMGGLISIAAKKYSIPSLVEFLSRFGDLGPGVDRTGLTGEFDFTLSWNEEDGPVLATALRDQLGLQMKSEKIPTSTFVVDSAEKPSGN